MSTKKKENKKGKQATPRYGVYIASAQTKTAKGLAREILRVLKTPAGDEVKKAAIQALTAALAPPVAVSNCAISC